MSSRIFRLEPLRPEIEKGRGATAIHAAAVVPIVGHSGEQGDGDEGRVRVRLICGVGCN